MTRPDTTTDGTDTDETHARTYRMVCEECGHEGTTGDFNTAKTLVGMHNNREHDGDSVAFWEEEGR